MRIQRETKELRVDAFAFTGNEPTERGEELKELKESLEKKLKIHAIINEVYELLPRKTFVLKGRISFQDFELCSAIQGVDNGIEEEVAQFLMGKPSKSRKFLETSKYGH